MKRHQLLFLILSLLALTCKKEPPPAVHIPTLTLTAVDASCTEAWLKLTTTQVPATVRLVRLTPTLQTLQTLQLTTPDTLVIDEGLLPNRTYTYKAYRLEGQTPNPSDSTQPVQLTTMDTTSHNFTWQIDTLGDGGGSVLYDVAIINDTLAYAVGEIYKRDSVGNWDPLPYNLVKWNGERWELKRVPFYYQGSTWYLPLRCITAFAPDDIWFEAGIHWDGTRYITVPYTIDYPARINKSWGTSSRDFYVVGDAGLIAHYDGVRWRRIESGTGLDMRDIWGATNPRTGELEILALASTVTPQVQGSMILKISGHSATPISTTGMSPDMFSIWFVSGRRYYAVGAGIHQKRMLSDSAWVAYPPGVVTHYFSGEVRGQDVNDVFVVGSFGEVVHYNGRSWFRYFSQVPLAVDYLGFVEVKHNLMVATGQISIGINTRGIILIGRR